VLRFAVACLSFAFLLSLTPSAVARPEFMGRYQSDPLRRADVDGCVACHLNPRGGGPRNEFGAAFGAEAFAITPMLRANFPDNFKFDTTKLSNGSVFYFSDPENKVVVFERDKQKVVIDLSTLSASKPKETVAPIPTAENRMSFFVTSKSPGKGGHLGGLAGADRHCQALAESAGVGDMTWRAYLSTSFQDKAAINAGDRIGDGPWYNAKRMLIARGPSDLHSGPRLSSEPALDEKGQPIDLSRHEILTGSLPNGTAAIGLNCNNWSSEDGKAMAGSIESRSSWNSGRPTNGCSQQTLKASSGEGLLYCFAIR